MTADEHPPTFTLKHDVGEAQTMQVRQQSLEEGIAAFIDDLRRLTPEQLHAAAALHEDSPGLRRAQQAVLAQAHGDGWTDELAQVESAVREFCSRQLAATGQEGGAGLQDLQLTHARRAAGPALVDAAVATIFATALPESTREELERPYVSVLPDLPRRKAARRRPG